MKKNRNKLLSLFLCLALLAGLICINTLTVSAEVKAGDSFAPDFAAWGSQNNNGWYYMYKDTDGIYRNLDYYDATASISWQQNAFAFNPSAMNEMLFINQKSFFTGELGSLPVYSFEMPASGTVTLSFQTHGPSGIGLRVYHGRTAVSFNGATEIAFNTAGFTSHSAKLEVKKGDRIYMEGFTTSASREGWVSNYCITYDTVSAEQEADHVYAPDTEGGWGVQNNNGWHYLYRDTVTGTYSEMNYIGASNTEENFTDCFSVDSIFPYCFITRDRMHPATKADPVKAFCAPVGGEVQLSVNACRGAQVLEGSPSLLRIYKGNEQIYPTDTAALTLTDSLSEIRLTTQVAKGEWIYIVLTCNGSNINGDVLMTESATYLSVNEAAMPVVSPVPVYEGFQIRENPENSALTDLRLTYSLSKEAFGNMGQTAEYSMTELGFVWAEAEQLNGRQPDLNNANVAVAQSINVGDPDSYLLTHKISAITDPSAVYAVRAYVKCKLDGVTRIFYSETSTASVNDYARYADPTGDIVTNPVTADLGSFSLTSAQGVLTVNKAYVASATWHKTKSPTSMSVSGSTVSGSFSGGSMSITAQSRPDGALALIPSATVTSGGIGGIGVGLSFSMDYDVILPAWGGVRLTKENPHAAPFPNDGPRSYIEYALEWDAQMFLIQGENGGWLVYHEDDGSQFKRLWLGNDGTNFNFVLETVPQAPYDNYTSFTANPWVVVAYEGDWTAGAALYKEFADEKFRVDAINAAKPRWVGEIQSMVLSDLDAYGIAGLEALAKEIDPSEVVVIVPGWRYYNYDVNYPDYTAKAGIKENVAYIQSLGYKVFVHVNLIGCDDEALEYTQYALEDDRYLDDYSKEPFLENWTTTYSVSFWLMNPASPDWQDLLVERLVAVYEELGVDGFHMDQSLLCYNDGRGYVNGMTSMQGNVALMKKLSEALPNCAFSGEGTNEITARYISFLQRAPYGINTGIASGAGSYDDRKIAMITPLDAYLWSGTTRLYHYPAMPTTENEATYNAYLRAGLRLGALPTMMRFSASEIISQSATTRRALNLMRWYQENDPVFNYARWDGEAYVVCYRTRGGKVVALSEALLW